ncbi:MAG: 30S ribosomal protein S1 [Armatimonadota bacterium]
MTDEMKELDTADEIEVSAEAASDETVSTSAEVEAPVEPVEAPKPVEVPVKAAEPTKEESGSHVDYSDTFRSLQEGDLVNGVVVHIDKEGVLVDVGTKSEGIIRPGELSASHVQSVDDVVSVGDRIDVIVIQAENEEGNLVLSKKRADFEKAWERVQQAHDDQRTLTAMVTDRVKGGLVVDLGIRGFVPGSHVGNGKVKNLDRYVGQSLPLKVLEVDRERRKVVLSHRLAIEEDREKQREETVEALKEGEIRAGVVRRITDYGAFVDLGGIDGLLHVSEMSWTRINHPSEVVKVGQKIHVMLLKLNLEAGRVSLGLRQILPDPWADIVARYKIGDLVNGPISRLVPFGTFVQLESGIEAIIPNSELCERRIKRPEDVVTVGETVEAKVIDIRPEERRMILSVRQLHEEKEHKEIDTYQAVKSDETRTTLGDLIGSKLQQQLRDIEDEPEEIEVTAEIVEIVEIEEIAEQPEQSEPTPEVVEQPEPADDTPEQVEEIVDAAEQPEQVESADEVKE